MERDPAPVFPPCPACSSAEHVHHHDDPLQGRWICMGCMLLFDGTSAEWARPKREPRAVREEIDHARAALEAAKERATR